MVITKSFILITSIMLAGCTVAPKVAYQGERLPSNKEAILSADSKHSAVGFNHKIFISKVNGKSMRDVGATMVGQMFPYPHVVYLEPGRYTIEFIYNIGLSHARAEVWFDAEEGSTYYATGELADGYAVKMWIKDSQGRPVGGIGKAPELNKSIQSTAGASAD